MSDARARAEQRWTQVAERGSMLGLRITIACYRLFGRPLSLALVHCIVTYFFLTGASARAAARAYQRRVVAMFGDGTELGAQPGSWECFQQFRAFALAIFDRIVLWFGDEEDFRYEVVGVESYDRLVTPECGAIVVGAHVGSFDALRALSRRDGRVVNVLMFTRNAPLINSFFQKLSPDTEIRVIQADSQSLDTVLRIRACIRRGELVAMLGDRVEPGDRGRSCRVPLLGGLVDLPAAPYLLAGLLGCPLFFMVALRERGGSYRVVAEVLTEKLEFVRGEREKQVQELAAAYAGRLEHYCALRPYQWFNFFDYWGEGSA
jgi:predicted LPLAT superfamily acyltransferase